MTAYAASSNVRGLENMCKEANIGKATHVSNIGIQSLGGCWLVKASLLRPIVVVLTWLFQVV
jgi:hypothetical protein